jgi:hypothetical protein
MPQNQADGRKILEIVQLKPAKLRGSSAGRVTQWWKDVAAVYLNAPRFKTWMRIHREQNAPMLMSPQTRTKSRIARSGGRIE